jgi:hypothetical protein
MCADMVIQIQMRNITELESFHIFVLTRHKDTESHETVWAGQAAVWGNDKCA